MTLFDICVTTTVNRRVVGSSPTGGAKKSRKTSVFLLFFSLPTDPNSDSATHSRTAVNWLGAPRCLRQMKRCSEQEETTSIAKRSKRARRLCFWPYALLVSPHLRCMKNEVATLMKCGKPHEKLVVRFTSCEHFMTTKLSLCVCRTNTSFIEISLY